MMCQQCGLRPANVYWTQIANGQKTELRLCEECARERGEMEFLLEPKFNIHNLMAGLLGQGSTLVQSPTLTRTRCPQCGLSYAQFVKSGLFGCAGCYEAFSAVIEPIVRRVHGNTRHVGKSPHSTGSKDLHRKLESLQAELQRAVHEERYEDAAQLRDQIRELKQQLSGSVDK